MTWARRAAWLLLLLGIGLIVAWGVRVALVGSSLLGDIAQVQALVDDPERADVETACHLIGELRGDVLAARREVGALAQLGPLLGWLPGIGGELEAAPHLLAVADGLSEAGALLCSVAEAAASGPAADAPSLERYASLLTEHQAAIAQATAAVGRAQDGWARVDVGRLSPAVAEKLAPLEEALPLLHAGLVLAQAAPDLLGFNAPQTYLILAQNEEELRPTGGFISGAGRLTMEQGQISTLSFMDASWADDYLHKPYPEPPEPLFHYMKSEIWLLRDANWSPDLPTSARQAAYFYEYGQGVHVDSVIAMDQRALELLLQVLGEIHLAGLAEPVTAANVRQFMREAWAPSEEGTNREWLFGRKEFMSRLAAAVRERIERNPDSVDWTAMLRAIQEALAGRHLQIVLDDPAAAGELARQGWDGALRQATGDYLFVVDANLGFNKANALISQTMAYRVALRSDGTARAELALTYTHQGTGPEASCRHGWHYSKDVTYDALIHNCYYDYLRLYVPAGSSLVTATAHRTPGAYLVSGQPDDGQATSLGDEAGKAVFAQFFVVEYGQALSTTFAYDLPGVVQADADGWRYTLLIQKQPGTGGLPLSLELALPPGARLLDAQPAPRAVDGTTLVYDLRLRTDVEVEVRYVK